MADDGGPRRGFREGEHEGDYGALCSLVSLLTQEHVMRLPDGLKRRRLANMFLRAKYRLAQGECWFGCQRRSIMRRDAPFSFLV